MGAPPEPSLHIPTHSDEEIVSLRQLGECAGITELEAECRGGLIAGKLKGLWEVNQGKKHSGNSHHENPQRFWLEVQLQERKMGSEQETRTGVVKRAETCCKSDKDAEVLRGCSGGIQ